jgi:hypothetical protein
MLHRITASHVRSLRRSGVVTIEMIAALPILALAANIIFQLTFDAAFVQGMSFAAIEAAREGAKVFPQGRPFLDPHGEPSPSYLDNDDIADSIMHIAMRRLGVLLPHIHRANGGGLDVTNAGVHVLIRRGGVMAHRGDLTVPIQIPSTTTTSDEIEVLVAVRTGKPSRASTNSNLTAEWVNGHDIAQIGSIRQASARAPLE